jgi:hypothetical protein
MALLNATTVETSTNQSPMAADAEPNSIMCIAIPALAVAMTGTTLAWISRKKNSRPYNLPKLRAIKSGGNLLCVLMLSVILLIPVATVNATTGGAVVWGSESTGAGTYQTPWVNWRKSQNEVDLQRFIANNVVQPYFSQGGYSPSLNHQGNYGSSKTQILNDITSLQSNHDRVAVVDFDHGVGLSPGYPTLLTPPGEFHYMFEDNTGTLIGTSQSYYTDPSHGVYDMDIYSTITYPDKIDFAFINTCLSADLSQQAWLTGNWPPYPDRPRGMAFAFTHRLIGSQMSSDGYSSPDGSGQCYIGFPWGSASLEQSIPKDGGLLYWGWIIRFFDTALHTTNTVNQALDTASLQTWGTTFGSSPLHTGFCAYWWPSWYPDTNSRMVVYGDGTVHLKIN